MDLTQLYAALEEADKRAQAGDEQAKADAAELAAMIAQYKEAPEAEEADYVNPIIPATAVGIASGAKGVVDIMPTAENIAKAMTPATPKTPSKAPTMFNPRGVSVEQSLENWRNYSEAQNEAAKGIRRDTALAKKYPNFQRKPLPMGPESTVARNLAREKLGLAAEGTGRFLNKVPGVNVAGGALAGYQGADAYNRFQRGDVAGGTVSTIGSAGSGAATLLGKSHPKLRTLGLATGVVAPLVNKGIDKLREEEEKAAGGPVGYAGGKAVKKGVEVAKKLFDPRFDKRVLEQEKLANQVLQTEKTGLKDIPKIYLPDYEGYGMVTSMSDRTAGGSRLLGVNDVKFNKPVELTGGQEYMYNNPGQAWASGKNPVNQIMREAVAMKKATGKDPLYIPWRMAPTASDFAHMTGETMLTHAQSAMGKAQKKDLDKLVKNFIPDWAGIDNPSSMGQFMEAPATIRKSIQNAIDRDLRGSGALSIGETRLAIADPSQLTAPEGGLMHVGRISADKPVIDVSGNVTYPKGVPGEGVGQLDREHFVTEFLPEFVKERGIPDVRSPRQTDIRALQMKPYSGIIDDKLLKALGYAKGGVAKKAFENTAKALRRDLVSGGYPETSSAAEAFADRAKSRLILPPAENAARTQIIGTLPTYEKAGSILQQRGATGRGIDFGAGLGEGAKALGKDFDTYEPFAKNWTPTYSNASDVPSDAYGQLTNLNVLNVVPREVRDEIVQDIGRVMQPGGMGIITTRGKDVMNAKGLAGPEPMSIITTRDTYQKGFNKDELEDYLKYMLGSGFEIDRLNLGPAGALIKKKAEGGTIKKEDITPEMWDWILKYGRDERLAADDGMNQLGLGNRGVNKTRRPTTKVPFLPNEVQPGMQHGLGMSDYELQEFKNQMGPLNGGDYMTHLKEGGRTPAWQRKEGKNPEGGLNAAGRASYNRETGGNLKAPQPEGGPRKKSFCARMSGMKKKLTSSETANDPDSRINKALRKWKC